MNRGGLKPRLGVIGGLGPLASADFYRKLTELTPAAVDTDHVPLVLLSLPHLPDRSQAILDRSDALLAPLEAAIETLNALGVEQIAMPCNTAHHWYERLASKSRAEIVHIVDSAVAELNASFSGRCVAVLATPGTLASGLYQERLCAAGYAPRLPAAVGFQEKVDAAIARVKAGAIAEAGDKLRDAIELCAGEEIGAAILACTELSVVSAAGEGIDGGPLIVDSNAALAAASLRRLGIEPKVQPSIRGAGRRRPAGALARHG